MRKDLNQHMEELKRCKDEEVVGNIFDNMEMMKGE